MTCRYACLFIAFVLIQSCTPTHYRLVHYADASGYQIDSSELRAVHLNPFKSLVFTTSVSGEKQQIKANQFWGYQDNKGIKFRIFSGGIYEVIQEKTMTIYRQANYGDGFNDEYYFSVSPNESILYLTTGNLKRAFKNQPCMLDLIQKMPLRHWFKTDGTGTFLLVYAFNYCQQQTNGKPLATH